MVIDDKTYKLNMLLFIVTGSVLKDKIRINIAFRIAIRTQQIKKNAWRHICSKHFLYQKKHSIKRFPIFKNHQEISGEIPLSEEIPRKID